MKGIIKVGTGIMQDFHFGKWPNCFPPKRHNNKVNEDMIFDVEWKGNYWDCRADGYGCLSSQGDIGDYGDGSIFVHDKDGVEIVALTKTTPTK